MPRPRGAPTPTRPDLIGRLDALSPRTPDMHVERAAGLPSGFLSKARKGRNAGGKATASWEKLEDWVAGKEGKSVAPAPSASGAGDGEQLLDAIARELELAKEPGQVDALINRLGGPALKGIVPETRVRAVCALLHEKRMVLELIAQQKKRADDGKPVEIVVKYENDWRATS